MRSITQIALILFLVGIMTSCSKYEVNPTNSAEEEVTEQRFLLITDEVEEMQLEGVHERTNRSLRGIELEDIEEQDGITDDDDDDDDSAEAQDKSSR